MSEKRDPDCSCTAAQYVGLAEDFVEPDAIAYFDPTCPVHRLDVSRLTETSG